MQCPVCNKNCKNNETFCSQCLWEFKMYVGETLAQEKQRLKIARRNWQRALLDVVTNVEPGNSGGSNKTEVEASIFYKKPKYTLRSKPFSSVPYGEAKSRFNLDNNWRPLRYTQNEFELITSTKIVADHATGLMWQQCGSAEYMKYPDASKYVQSINSKKFAGFNDWRLPTIDELMSLLINNESGDLYIDLIFDNNQDWYFSSDKYDARCLGWLVLCLNGKIHWDYKEEACVRAVRTGQKIKSDAKSNVKHEIKRCSNKSEFKKTSKIEPAQPDFLYSENSPPQTENEQAIMAVTKDIYAQDKALESIESKMMSTFKNSLGMEFVYIAPATFIMGSPKNEPERKDNEVQHEVTLTRGFYMQTTPVTVDQWRKFITENDFKTEGEIVGYSDTWAHPGFNQTGTHPVVCVSWNDVQAFIKWLTTQEKRAYSLPIEAEWEYACRAGTTTSFYTGRCLSTDDANYNGNFPIGDCPKGINRKQTTPVKKFAPNPWGIYDMHGNVREWCQDVNRKYKAHSVIDSVTDPFSKTHFPFRITRGGAWPFAAESCRSAFRKPTMSSLSFHSYGFRLVFRTYE